VNGQRTYLDWNATAPLRPEARDALVAALDEAGNPSSVHAEGRRARALVEAARAEVAALAGADVDDVYFTSGATEGNSWVLRSGWDTIVRADIEHDSVIRPSEASGARIVTVPTSSDGTVTPEGVEKAIHGLEQLGRALIAVQLANNETGVVQPVAEIAAIAKSRGFPVLTDAVQAAGRIELDMDRLGASYLVLSAHKLGGPKGVGALIARPGWPLAPLIAGGGQERRQRGGTENVAGIAAFGAAAKAARCDAESVAANRMAGLRARLEAGIALITPQAVIVGGTATRLPNTTCIAVPGRRAEVLVAALDLAGIAVSAGAACSSGKVGRSRVLEAMGVQSEIADGAIRVSLGHATTENDISAFLAAWQSVAHVRRQAA
jgi:cysteine desulfurase